MLSLNIVCSHHSVFKRISATPENTASPAVPIPAVPLSLLTSTHLRRSPRLPCASTHRRSPRLPCASTHRCPPWLPCYSTHRCPPWLPCYSTHRRLCKAKFRQRRCRASNFNLNRGSRQSRPANMLCRLHAGIRRIRVGWSRLPRERRDCYMGVGSYCTFSVQVVDTHSDSRYILP